MSNYDDNKRQYIAAINSPGFYWEFSQDQWQALDDEGYGPFLCSKVEILRWENQMAKEEGRDPWSWDRLVRGVKR